MGGTGVKGVDIFLFVSVYPDTRCLCVSVKGPISRDPVLEYPSPCQKTTLLPWGPIRDHL